MPCGTNPSIAFGEVSAAPRGPRRARRPLSSSPTYGPPPKPCPRTSGASGTGPSSCSGSPGPSDVRNSSPWTWPTWNSASKGRSPTCAARRRRNLLAWLEKAGILEGAVFRPVNKAGRVLPGCLTDRSVALVVKRAALAAGLDPTQYAGHSLRASLATAAALEGVHERVVMAQTRHKGVAMVRRYIREGSLFKHNTASRPGGPVSSGGLFMRRRIKGRAHGSGGEPPGTERPPGQKERPAPGVSFLNFLLPGRDDEDASLPSRVPGNPGPTAEVARRFSLFVVSVVSLASRDWPPLKTGPG